MEKVIQENKLNILSDRAEYDTFEFAKIRTTEIRALLENNQVEKRLIPVIVEEYNLLAQHMRNCGEEIDDIEEC